MEITKAKLAELYEAEIVKMQDVLQQVEMLLRTARVYEEEMQTEDVTFSVRTLGLCQAINATSAQP